MSRRSGRDRPQKTAAALPESVRRGLASIIVGNEAAIAGMLDKSPDSDLLEALIGVLAVNSLNAEGLLAQWFSQKMLSNYAEQIGKSPKGSQITLAARIAAAWAKPTFQPPSELQPQEEAAAGKEDADDVASGEDEPAAKRAKTDKKEANQDSGVSHGSPKEPLCDSREA